MKVKFVYGILQNQLNLFILLLFRVVDLQLNLKSHFYPGIVSCLGSETKTSVKWNPDAITQLIVASDEDDSPALRLWDMCNIMAPVKEFVGHTKGVIAMSWCPIDSSYLLTCAKDNPTICWDTVSGEGCGLQGEGDNNFRAGKNRTN